MSGWPDRFELRTELVFIAGMAMLEMLDSRGAGRSTPCIDISNYREPLIAACQAGSEVIARVGLDKEGVRRALIIDVYT